MSSKKEKNRLLAKDRHWPVAEFLSHEPWYSKLINLIEIGQQRTFLHLLLGKHPVTAEKIKGMFGDIEISTARISQIMVSIDQCLAEFSKSKHGLNSTDFVIKIPGKDDRKRTGYYLSCQRKSDKKYLVDEEATKALWDINKNRIADVLRAHLQEEAEHTLSEKLQGTEYQEVELECGKLSEQNSGFHGESDFETSEQHGRDWKWFRKETLIDPKGMFILSCNAGAGKSTFLRSLQTKILDKNKRLPIFLHASDLEGYKFKNIRGLARCITSRLQAESQEKEIEDFLTEELQTNVVLLIDGVDQISRVGTAYRSFLNQLLDLCSRNGIDIVIASRPSAVTNQESNGKVEFLRLKPFNTEFQKAYFGKNYSRAHELCQRDENMMAVPMLAFMVNRLIEEGKDRGIANRTELYRRFIDYIIEEYEHENSCLKEGEKIHIRRLLQEISYKALAHDKPFIQIVPLDKCFEFVVEYEKIDRFPKYGLVNFIVNQSKGARKCLYFTHQSFQEYLSAEYISERKEEREKVIAEKWNPKWKEVMKFLCGINGQCIIKQILAEKDNPIHSKLFLAAELAQETQLTNYELKRTLWEKLENLLTDCVFKEKAEKHLFYVDQNRALERLRAMLADEDKDVVRNALRALRELKGKADKNIVEKIVVRLEDEDQDVVGEATFALEELKDKVDKDIVEKIAAMLEDENKKVVWAAIWALAELKGKVDKDIVKKIATKLENEDKRVVRAAICALAELKGKVDKDIVKKIATKLENEDKRVVLSAISALRHLEDKVDKDIVKKIVTKLEDKDEDQDVVEDAIRALEELNDKVDTDIVEKIAAMLEDDDKNVVQDAIYVLGKLKTKVSKDIVEKVVAKLEDDDEDIMHEAIQALEELNDKVDKDIVLKIVSKLEDDDEVVVRAAICALAELNDKVDKDIVEKIAAMLEDEDQNVVRAAIRALGGLNDKVNKDIVEKIAAMLADEDKDVVRNALRTLRELKDRADKDIALKIAAKVDDEDRVVVWAAIRALGKLNDKVEKDIVKKIVAKLEDDDEDIVWAAIWALEELNDKVDTDIVEKIAAMLEDENKKVVWAAIRALEELNDKVDTDIVEKIAVRLEDENKKVVWAAIRALEELNDKVDTDIVEKIAAMLEDEDQNVVQEAIFVLEDCKDKVDKDIIKKMPARLEDETEGVADTASRMLREWKDKVDEDVVKKLTEMRNKHSVEVLQSWYRSGKLEYLTVDPKQES